MPIFHPEAFQGSLNRSRYFEGWYIKQVSADRKAVYSFIPGISLSKSDPHAFIQVINGINAQTHYFTFPVKAFSAHRSRFDVAIAGNRFSSEGITLDLEKDNIRIKGELSFRDRIIFPSSLIAPGIMGPFSYLPGMECNHGLVSADHEIAGTLDIGSSALDFTEGDGYIEKDWGRSFPQCWIWAQCNSFDIPRSSFMISIAKIPSFGRDFTGFLGFFFHQGTFHTFATWNGSKILSVSRQGSLLTIELQKKPYIYTIIIRHESSGVLLAPSSGAMNRRIKESVDSTLSVRVSDISRTKVAEVHGIRAGLEVIESIFEVLRQSGVACSV